jgi:hypothetical protein
MTSISVDTLDDTDFPAEQAGINPYPGSDKKTWTSTFASTLADETGLPVDVTAAVAAYVVHPKDYLQRTGGGYKVRAGAITERDGLRILQVRAHGFAGTPGEHNERIRGSFDSPLHPKANPDHILPTLRTGEVPGGPATHLPYLTTAPVDLNRQAKLLAWMEKALDDADGDRGYRLVDDIALFGQQEPTLHAILLRQVEEPTGTGVKIRPVVDLTAIKGANRSRARLALFGLKVHDVIFGVDPKKTMGITAPEARSADPTWWVPLLADTLRSAYDNASHPGHEIAVRAAKVATVQLQVIVGAVDTSAFHTTVFDPNRADHRRPPLDYAISEKAASDLRAVLRDAAIFGWLTEAERAWLSGEGPDPHAVADESVADRRDRRDRALFSVIFPSSVARQQRVRAVLGEPAPSQATSRRHIDGRTRVISAGVSDAYTQRWNPRVLDGLLPVSSIKTKLTFTDETWSDLLDRAAAGDAKALADFILTRGMHWLAEHKIVEADRGSVGAQLDDPEAETRRIRRTMNSVREALRLSPLRTVGLMRELARAANDLDLPRQVDADGVPVDKTVANRSWFDTAFPKTAKPKAAPVLPTDDPQEPDPTPEQLLITARMAYFGLTTETLPAVFVQVLEAAQQLEAAAQIAGQIALTDEHGELIKQLIEAGKAVRDDAKTLNSLPSLLQQGDVDVEDFASACGTFLTAKADE